MAATPYQCANLRLLADHRRQRGDSYVAGGVALNQLLSRPRRSRDIGLFRDSDEALFATWFADRALLLGRGYKVDAFREAPSFVEAWLSLGSERVIMQWARDSAFRFIPLVEDELMGLALCRSSRYQGHPFRSIIASTQPYCCG